MSEFKVGDFITVSEKRYPDGDDQFLPGMSGQIVEPRDGDGDYEIVYQTPSGGSVCQYVHESTVIPLYPNGDPVSAPSHYRSHPSGIEVIEITKHMGFLDGNVIKYVLRAPYKGKEIEDLKKARQYLDWLIEEKENA